LRAYEILVTPLPPDRLALGPQRVCALVFVTDPERTPGSPLHRLADLYGLTPAESRVAQKLMAGLSTQEVADQNAVSINTVRTQVKSLLSKTDCRRQSQLVRLLYRSVASLAG